MSNEKVFGVLPTSANRDAIVPFEINIENDAIERMRTLIQLSPIAEPCHENAGSGSQKYGAQRDWLIGMRDKWLNDFDWKHHEIHLNSYPHFLAKVNSPESNPFKLHFIALFSSRQDAIPILLSHGWPGSFLEFLPILDLILKQYNNDPSQMPYHFIVPSLPGFAFSSMPSIQENFSGRKSLAHVFNNLMTTIFGPTTKYIAQGGDIGSSVSRILAAKYPNCIAAHLNFCIINEPTRADSAEPLEVTDLEQRGLKRLQTFQSTGSAYANMQGTRPSTLGLVLSSSPLALLSWIGEKYIAWSDPSSFPQSPSHSSPSSPFSTDILLSTSLYWLTGHIATTFYIYREVFESTSPATHGSPDLHVQAPKMLGFSWFPMDMPVPISWTATTGNLVWWRRHEVGGHFAALERPEVLWGDLQDFLRVVREKEGMSEE